MWPFRKASPPEPPKPRTWQEYKKAKIRDTALQMQRDMKAKGISVPERSRLI